MKKSLMFVGLFLLLSNIILVSAGCPNTPGLHGVKIGDYCADCSEISDGICPDDFGDDVCKGQYDVDCPVVEKIYWSRDGISQFQGEVISIDVLSGENVSLIVSGVTSLSVGDKVNFTIYEKDTVTPDDYVYTVSGTVENTYDKKAEAEVRLEESSSLVEAIETAIVQDATENGAFYFTVALASTGTWPGTITRTVGEVGFNITRGGKSYSTCGDYTEEGNESCEEDRFDIGGKIEERTEGGCIYQSTGYCEWNSVSDSCAQTLSAEETINENTTQCPSGTENPRLFACPYPNENKLGNCDAGDEFFKVIYSSTADRPECTSYETQPIPCPASLRLPFFGFYGIVSSLLMISFVYFFFRKKFE